MDGSRQDNSLITTAGRFLALIMPALIMFGLGQLTVAASAADAVAPDSKTIVFVCLHGSVKSQMAAAHFNRIARERGLPYTAISRGIEVDSSIPTRIRDNLNLDGLAPLDDVPHPLMPSEAAGAVKVIAFDTVPDDKRGVAEVNYWSDVPPATKDYAAARDVIVRHIDDLIPALAERPRPQETCAAWSPASTSAAIASPCASPGMPAPTSGSRTVSCSMRCATAIRWKSPWRISRARRRSSD